MLWESTRRSVLGSDCMSKSNCSLALCHHEESEVKRWRLNALDKFVPDRQTDRQIDRQSDTLSSSRSQKQFQQVFFSYTPNSLIWANFSSEGKSSEPKLLISILLSITAPQLFLGLSQMLLMITLLQDLHTCLQTSSIAGLQRPIINIIWSKIRSGRSSQPSLSEDDISKCLKEEMQINWQKSQSETLTQLFLIFIGNNVISKSTRSIWFLFWSQSQNLSFFFFLSSFLRCPSSESTTNFDFYPIYLQRKVH